MNESPDGDRGGDNRTGVRPVNSPPSSTEISASIENINLRSEIVDIFDRETWHVIEACLSAHSTLLIDGAEPLGLMIVGPSGCGKTTALRTLFDLDPQVYRSDDLTPASFVSHDASKEENELEEVDLLERVKHRTLVCKEMATWFSGTRELIEDRWATLANVLDGDGYTRDSGAHGQRGYQGDYRFNFTGATTPLPRRAWDVMGKAGNRFVFHEMGREERSTQDILDNVYDEDGKEYSTKVDLGSVFVRAAVEEIWHEAGGYAGVTWESTPDEAVKSAIGYLAELVAHARAPVKDDVSRPEDPQRLAATLRDLTRGHALLYGRTRVTPDDLPVVARVALSTMHAKRRPLVRELVNPDTPATLKTAEVAHALNVTDKTAKKRMELMDTLGIGTFIEGRGSESNTITLANRFRWPGVVEFPDI